MNGESAHHLSLPSKAGWGDGESSGHVELRPQQRSYANGTGILGVKGSVQGLRGLSQDVSAVPGLGRRNALLLIADAAALATGCTVATVTWEVLYEAPNPLDPWLVVAVSALCIAAFVASGLYSAFPLPPVEEVSASVKAVSAAIIAVGVTVLVTPGTDLGLVLVSLPIVWVHLLFLTPLLRAAMRGLCASRSWWGCPVVVLGAGPAARRVVRLLQLQPELGLRPVAVLHDSPEERSRVTAVTDVAVPGGLSLAPVLATRYGLRYAVLAFSQGEDHRVAGVIERHGRLFRRVLVVPDSSGVASLWVGTRDVGGALGFEVEHRLLVAWRRWLKRGLDVVAALVGILVLSPVLLALAVVIRLGSEGPIFYVQDRLGRDGRCFRVLKFRTMYVGAHERLREVLEHDAAARAEYHRFAKLKDDPRVTRVGRFLRRYSLDEFPQLFNVLRGEMSLVGPRAYLPEELPRMVGKHRRILHVAPGMSGLWQVSGRNELPFDMRLELDVRYVRNWSLSLDLYLLARTIPTVLFARGAA